MFDKQVEESCGEPIVIGIEFFCPISSTPGSSTLIFTQPLLTGKIFESSAVIIGAQIILYIAHHLFGYKSIPIMDTKNNQTIQMPLSELQDFLKWMANGSGTFANLSSANTESNQNTNVDLGITGTIGDRGFQTPQSPEAPLVLAIYVIGNFSNKPYTPIVEIIVPILTFPGLRGALPILIISLLATIFVRAVVPPESTGARPLAKPSPLNNNTNPLTFTPNDLLKMFTKFGKHFNTN
ncbi:hypothetical protein [Desulfosporosinus hippei]|uniref:Uncharacterized protein n=1 Tax=Desulfosporosinus hippei DSM 8344 TaxID=1121419 RepID=A0A1G8A217_9FIRM|nr:hypothetical protein [Desulfosporosinus hippei]SDH14974.1 hypothetical protein SAMN05443529_11081 [Desulfosporosinus hippei DSM 8344]